MSVRTRVAPSPTGYFHLGNLRVVLTDYAMAKKFGGQFIWRNEDTDQERFIADALEYNMKWTREFGLDWDEGPDKGGPYAPYTQTERLGMYKEAYEKLIEKDYAYRCFCTKERLDELRQLQQETKQQTKYDGRCRNLSKEEVDANLKNNMPFTVRIKIPKDRKIEFTDAITHNHITWNSNDVDDYIIVKSNGIPTYHLAAMYDDVAMKITHIFRGAEWIATTPVHILIFEGLGVSKEEMPKIGHFTVILDPNTPGKKFSKRNSAFRINGLLIKGYLKEAILNYLMLLGWAPKDNRELFTLEEFVQAFDLNGMQKANPTWDQKKMDWFNGQYSRKLSLEEYTDKFIYWIKNYFISQPKEETLAALVKEDTSEQEVVDMITFAESLLNEDRAKLVEIIKLVQERAVNFLEVLDQIHFFYKAPKNVNYDIKQVSHFKEKLNDVRAKVIDVIESLPDDATKWIQDDWANSMREIANEFGIKGGDPFMVLRLAVVGGPFSPPLFEALQILGKQEVLNRLKNN